MTDAFTQGMLLQCQCDLEALKAEIEGMKAKNIERVSNGHSLAYGEEAFSNIASQMASIGHNARELGQRGS